MDVLFGELTDWLEAGVILGELRVRVLHETPEPLLKPAGTCGGVT